MTYLRKTKSSSVYESTNFFLKKTNSSSTAYESTDHIATLAIGNLSDCDNLFLLVKSKHNSCLILLPARYDP